MQIDETKQVALWTGNFLLLLLTNLAAFLSFQMLLPTLPKYVVQIGGSDTSVGLIIGIFTISAVLVRPWLGRDLDRRGRKAIFILGLAVLVLSSLLYNLATMVWLLLAIRVIHGIGWGGCTTAAGTVASDIIPPARRGEGMGYFGLSANLSVAVGPAVGIAIMNILGFPHLFAFSAVFALVALALALLVNYSTATTKTDNTSRLVEPKAILPGLVIFFVTIPLGGIISFITLLGLEKGIENVAPFFTVYAIALMLSRPLAGLATDRLGPGWAVLPGMVLQISGLFALSMTNGMGMLLWAGVLYGAGFGAVQPVMQTLTIDVVSPEKHGSATATFFSAVDLGIGTGSFVLGLTAHLTSYVSMYRTAIIFLLPGLIIYLVCYRHFHNVRLQARG